MGYEVPVILLSFISYLSMTIISTIFQQYEKNWSDFSSMFELKLRLQFIVVASILCSLLFKLISLLFDNLFDFFLSILSDGRIDRPCFFGEVFLLTFLYAPLIIVLDFIVGK